MLSPTAWAAPSTGWPDSHAPVSSSAWRPDSRRASTSSWPGSRRSKEIIMAEDREDAAGDLGWVFLGGVILAASRAMYVFSMVVAALGVFSTLNGFLLLVRIGALDH